MHYPKIKFCHTKQLLYDERVEKSVMLWSEFKNIFNKNKTHFNWQKYKHQRNLCLNLLRKTKKTILCQIKCEGRSRQ